MSALTPKADIGQRAPQVRFVPIASFAAAQKSSGLFAVVNEPAHDPRCRERDGRTSLIPTDLQQRVNTRRAPLSPPEFGIWISCLLLVESSKLVNLPGSNGVQ